MCDCRDEHRKHSPNCPFLSIQNPAEITVEDMMKLMRDRYRLLCVSFCAETCSCSSHVTRSADL